jgi:ribonuclease HI
MRVKVVETWLVNVVLLSNLTNVVTSLVVIVQFDGSLRPPNDFGIPTTSLGRMAACACSIRHLGAGSEVNSFLVGGKGLVASSTTTSGEVEYEGLLFALTTLRSYITTRGGCIINESEDLNIQIQGDCKTVIDQMNGKSIPRKLEHYFHQAVAKVLEIEHEMLLIGHANKIQFQHVPRSNNVVCDRVSACIILNQEIKVYKDICNLLVTALSDNSTFDVTMILDLWFQPGKSFVKLSKRPKIYHYMVELATNMKDYVGLLKVLDRYESDIKTLELNMIKANRRNGNSESRQNLKYTYDIAKEEVITYQIHAMNALGRNKDAARLKHKNRVMLNTLKSKEFNNELRFYGAPDLSLLSSYTNELDVDNWGDRSDWPSCVQRWLNEASQSQNWNETYEWISYP